MSESRPIRLPAADFHLKALPFVQLDRLDALRIHGSSYPAISFLRGRSNRYSHREAPGGSLYLGETMLTCLWECFGDAILDGGSAISGAIWQSRKLSRIVSTSPLKICDLTHLNTRTSLGVDLSALKHTSLEVPQAWGLAIYNHPETVDGLRFTSRFTGGPCLALFERPGLADSLSETALASLPDLDEAAEFLEASQLVIV